MKRILIILFSFVLISCGTYRYNRYTDDLYYSPPMLFPNNNINGFRYWYPNLYLPWGYNYFYVTPSQPFRRSEPRKIELPKEQKSQQSAPIRRFENKDK